MIPTDKRLQELLAPYLPVHPEIQKEGAQEVQPLCARTIQQLGAYLELLLKWNARTNLTAIREPEEIVRRHFGESLFLAHSARGLLSAGAIVLDLGSGAGFPGIPLQLLYPELRVTLAESQGKKAAFLREAVRTLHLQTEVWHARAESIPAARVFDLVTMRAVDKWDEALVEAQRRVAAKGTLALLTGDSLSSTLKIGTERSRTLVPESNGRYLWLCRM